MEPEPPAPNPSFDWYAQAPPLRRSRGERVVLTALAFLVAVAVLASAMGAGWLLARARVGARPLSPAVHGSIQLVPQQTATGTADAASVAARVAPALVDINIILAGGGSAAGTGMVLTPTGEVLTNNHVVKGAGSIRVNLTTASDSHAAHVVGVDPTADVAVIQVDGVSGWPTVRLADSSTLSVGQAVIAIGNALGRGGAPSVTSGTITALGVSITASDGSSSEQLSGLIETDASISPGDSGGALVNGAGQVVGMITAGETQGFRRRATSVAGYAVPVSTAAAIVERIDSGSGGPDIITGQPGYLGVQVTTLDSATAARLGVRTGVLVGGVVSGAPAERAGLRAGSVITAIDGRSVGSPDELGTAIKSRKPGDRVSVRWVDASGSHSTTVALATGPPV